MLKDYKFKINDEVVIVGNAKDLLHLRGEKATVVYMLPSSYNHDYIIAFENKNELRVKEKEIAPIDNKELLNIKIGDLVVYVPTQEIGEVLKVDYFHGHVEIRFKDNGSAVTGIESIRKIENEGEVVQKEQGKFEKIATELGQFTDMKNKQYGSSVDATYEMMKALMERYKNEDDSYTIPQSLLQHILLQVRMMDKINRIFNNPSGKGDSESPYRDLTGYSLIGVDMVEGK